MRRENSPAPAAGAPPAPPGAPPPGAGAGAPGGGAAGSPPARAARMDDVSAMLTLACTAPMRACWMKNQERCALCPRSTASSAASRACAPGIGSG